MYAVLNNTTLFSTKKILKLVDDCRRYSKPKPCPFSRHVMQHDRKDIISGVHVNVSQGSAETLVRRGGITNRHLIAYSRSNICAKNCQNRLMCVEVIVCNTSVVLDSIIIIK